MCAREGASGRAYQVSAIAISGQELIAKTNSFQYTPFAQYVVIFWTQQQASVIQLDYPALSAIPMGGHDQLGRPWEIAVTPACF